MVAIVVLTLAEGDVVISSMLMTPLLLSLWFLALVMQVTEASAGSDTVEDSWQQHYWMEMNRSSK